MKVLIVNKLYAPWIGGVETVVREIAEGLSKDHSFSVEVLACQPKGKTTKEQINGVDITKAGSFGVLLKTPVSFSFFKLFKQKSENVDLVNIHHPSPLAFLAYLLYKPKARLVVHYHADIVKQRITGWFFRPLVHRVLTRAEKIIVSNPRIVETSPVLGSHKNKCVVTPFGVDAQSLLSLVNETEVEKLQKEHGPFTLFVGRLSYYKGVEYLLRAVVKTQKKLVIIGVGEEESKLRALAKTLDITHLVQFLPPQPFEMLVQYYRAAQVFILPSIARSEAYGMVLLDAMALGTPVVSTEIGTGTSYVNEDGVTGYVVPPRDPLALALAIDKLYDSGTRERLGKAAQERVLSGFTLEGMIAKTKVVFTSSS